VTRFIKEVVPDAQIEARRVDRVEIKVFLVEGGAETAVFSSAQREFFGKNGHRGKKPLQGTCPPLCVCICIYVYMDVSICLCMRVRVHMYDVSMSNYIY
jgi:hypothetical protein